MQKLKKISDKEKLENQYEDLKRQMNIEREKYTLVQYEILRKAYSIGKKIERHFTKQQLAIDFNVSYFKVKRLLSLERMSNKTKQLVKQKKIPLFIVATITSGKNRFFQEEIVDMVIEKGYSSYDIKGIKIDQLSDMHKFEDMRMERVRKKGYTRIYSSYMGFNRAINNIFIFLN